MPEKASQPWREVLDITAAEINREAVLAKANALLLANNPDQGGDRDVYERIILARKQALAEVARA